MEKLQITYDAALSQLTSVNSSFDSGVLRIAHAGENRKGTAISREAFEKALPTIFNCPLVCRYDREADEIGAHDVDIVDGDFVNVTHPIGVVPESARVWWAPSGERLDEKEYLCVEVLLWKRQEAYHKLKANGVTAESMEITVREGKREGAFFHILDFEFTAFCLLGTAAPCFRPNRSVEHSIAKTYQLLQRSNLHYVIEFDIKGFFDNVNHSKLIRQIWALGIRDKHLIYILRKILSA
jgi:hypothetical protein